MRTAGLLILTILFPAFAHAAINFTEIMYDLPGTDTGREWVEITNTGDGAVDVNGYKFFEANVNHTLTLIAGDGILQPGGSAVVADDSAKFKLDWPSYSGILFDSSFSLSNVGESIALKDGALTLLDSVSYDPSLGAAGDGATLQWNGSAFTSAAPTPGAYAGGSGSSSDASSLATSATTTPSSGGSPAEYLPIPELRILAGGARTVSAGADTPFTAVVYDDRGNKRDDAVVVWTFGDGMRRTGASVFHSYYSPGEYVAVVRASTSDGGDASSEMVITAKDASIKIVSVSSRGISLMNRDTRTLDLSLWRLSANGTEFKIPENTQILAGRTILLPSQIIQLPLTNSASLLYPSGEVAAVYPDVVTRTQSGMISQPSPGMTSYKEVQAVEPPAVSTVEPIISTQANIQAYEEAVDAPTAATELAAVGAVSTPSIFRSPWFLSFLGVVALAGTAFIFL